MQSLKTLYDVVLSRQTHHEEGSYTGYLFEQGRDKILKKVGEEASEVIIAAKNDDQDEIIAELADLMYHLTVLMVDAEIPFSALDDELARRSAKIGNRKTQHQVDHNS